MLIMYWSSDVCSSDLRLFILEQRLRDLGEILGGQLRHRAVIGEQAIQFALDIARFGIDRRREPQFLRLADDLVELDLVTAAIIFLVGRALIDARVAVGEPQMPGDRQADAAELAGPDRPIGLDRKSTRLNSSP